MVCEIIWAYTIAGSIHKYHNPELCLIYLKLTSDPADFFLLHFCNPREGRRVNGVAINRVALDWLASSNIATKVARMYIQGPFLTAGWSELCCLPWLLPSLGGCTAVDAHSTLVPWQNQLIDPFIGFYWAIVTTGTFPKSRDWKLAGERHYYHWKVNGTQLSDRWQRNDTALGSLVSKRHQKAYSHIIKHCDQTLSAPANVGFLRGEGEEEERERERETCRVMWRGTGKTTEVRVNELPEFQTGILCLHMKW